MLNFDVVKIYFGGFFCWFDVIYKSILFMNRLVMIVFGVNFYFFFLICKVGNILLLILCIYLCNK